MGKGVPLRPIHRLKLQVLARVLRDLVVGLTIVKDRGAGGTVLNRRGYLVVGNRDLGDGLVVVDEVPSPPGGAWRRKVTVTPVGSQVTGRATGGAATGVGAS